MRVIGRAKINLFLRVVGRRPDGYHEIESVMQSVELTDELELRQAATTGVSFQWAPGLGGEMPERPDLVERAIGLYRIRDAPAPEARVRVTKRIPIGAGLGGGSADAAAALAGIDALGGMRRSWAELELLAGELGSDVPFALAGGTRTATGRGERLSPLACPASLWWILGISRHCLRTPQVYRRWDEAELPTGPGWEQITAALAGGFPEEIGPLLHNDLEPAALELWPPLRDLEHAIVRGGALGVVMTGSGPTIAGLCRDERHARAVAEAVRPAFHRVEVVASARAGAEIVARA